jgi:hypothetical protein
VFRVAEDKDLNLVPKRCRKGLREKGVNVCATWLPVVFGGRLLLVHMIILNNFVFFLFDRKLLSRVTRA